MMEVAEQMAGLKKFLKEFTLIDKKEPIEVNNEEPIEKRETFGNVFGRFKIMNKEETNDEEK